jgi:hypothetical protein
MNEPNERLQAIQHALVQLADLGGRVCFDRAAEFVLTEQQSLF